ncbi:MAG: AAA family ATPase [Hyphomonadaceae bacterium]
MRVLSIVSTKGGVGKTTLAVHLAVAACQAGEGTLVLDLDPQRSAVQWWKDRKRTIAERGMPAGASFDVWPAEAGDLAQAIERAEQSGFTLIIIDTPPHADFPAARAVEVADLVLMPVRPSCLDLHAAKATIALIRDLQKPAFFVVSQVPHNSQATGVDASDFLEAKGIKKGPLTITLLQDYVRALRDGLTAPETHPEGRHASEIGDLFRWTSAQLDIARMQRRRRAAKSSTKPTDSALLGDPFADLALPPISEESAA